MAIGEEGVEVGRTQRLAHVDEEIEVLRLRIAVAEVEAVEARFARVEGGRRRTDVIGPQVVALAVGEVAVAIFAGEVEEAAVADRQADVDAIGQHRTVARLALAVAVRLQVARVGRIERRRIAEQAVEIGHPVQRRHIFAVAHLRAAAFARGLQLDVDHARDRIRTILRGGAVAQHLDPLDRERGDHVHVDRRRTAPDGAVDVEQRRHVAALAVEQHQRLVGVQAAQRRGPRHVGAVGDRGLREVERGDQLVQRLVELPGARRLQRAARNDVDRHGAVDRGPVGDAAADDDDLVGRFVALRRRIGRRFLAGRRLHRLRPGGCGEDRQGCRHGDAGKQDCALHDIPLFRAA